MTSPVKQYQKEIHNNLGFFATWLPGDKIELGEAGLFEGGRFRKQSSLAELRIAYEASPKSSPQTLQYASTTGTKVDLSAAVAAEVPLAKAEITIEFSREGAFLFHALNVRHMRIENRSAVAAAILSAYERGNWKKDWYMIESLHVAECATIIVSQDRSAGLVLSASTDVPLGSIPLADPKVDLTVSSTRGKLIHVISNRNLRPLYSCLRLKDQWFQSPSIVPVRGEIDHQMNWKEAFTRPAIDELLDS